MAGLSPSWAPPHGAAAPPTRVIVHGMGGVDKTTLLALLLREAQEEVCAAFDRVCWIAFGQEPNLPELQKSLHRQLTGGEELVGVPEGPKREEAALRKLHEAAKGQRVLVILDDAWEARHEKALNPLDPREQTSRLLVSTRLRRLLGAKKNLVEVDVGLLTQSEAVRLLLETGEMMLPGSTGEDEDDEAAPPPQEAFEIVELCGRLPLTVAIAGGVLRNYGVLDADLVQLLRDDQLRAEKDGFTVEDRDSPEPIFPPPIFELLRFVKWSAGPIFANCNC